MALTDENNEMAETYSYKAYGQPTIKDRKGTVFDISPIGNPYLFTARELDSESGLYYFRARYYDWHRGAFTQEDPIGFDSGDINLFRYVANQPTNYNDPNGQILPVLDPMIIGAGLGAGTSFLATVISQSLTGNVDWAVVGKSTLVGGLTGAAMPFLGTAKLEAVLLGAGGSAAQYYLSTDKSDLTMKGILLSTALGGVGGYVGGPFVMPKPTIFFPTTWLLIAKDNITSVGLGRGVTGAYIGGLNERCLK
ncbi:MAG: hypothetical protein AUJ51_08485 [Elusimicrobia bacterium CG1_02_56_21]|nr:MAG: hypothetical protein AUJ51_08485 [Elusimicrobia bacterium CG1_02_56_21]